MRQIRRIGVIGAGTMGNGIAQASAILLQNTRAAGRPKDLADVTTLESASEE
jgi:3-hydroxyacyl-CoA dehydrogenase